MTHKRLGFMQLTIIIGFSLFYAWYLIAFFGLFMFAPTQASFAQMHVGQAAFFAGSIIATFLLLALFRRMGSSAHGPMRLLHIAGVLPGALLPCLVALGEFMGYPPLPVFYLVCALSGASMAFGFMVWEDLVTHGYLNRGVLAHGTIFSAGGALFLAAAAFLSPIEMAVSSVVLLCASTALLAFIMPRCDSLEDKPLDKTKEYFRSSWHLDIVVSVINVAFGYAFMLLYFHDTALLLTTMAIAILADLAFSIAFGRGKWVVFAGWVRICAAVASCALLLLIVPENTAHVIALGALVVFWFVFRTMNGGSLTDLANHRDFSMLYSSTRGKLPANVGFTVGLIIGIAALATPAASLPIAPEPYSLDAAHFYIPLALVAIFVLTALFFLPFDNESPSAGYKTLALVDMHESPDASMRKNCDAITAQFKLSPRESEVLTYLVKGRNAKHIAEKLYVSESTVKTHISNIYRKVGIHSQQELLDQLDKI